jgi:hypothetical protein
MRFIKFFTIITTLLINSCDYPEMKSNEIVYENNFEDFDLTSIDGGGISYYNNTNVLGDFNNDGFNLNLNDLEDHDYIVISFDLYIHGSWDGNTNRFKEDDRPDTWNIEFNHGIDFLKDSSTDFYSTTFSNSPCFSNYCLKQSYPDQFPSENPPKFSAFETDLEKICFSNPRFGGPSTTLYKIEKTFKSGGNSVLIRFYDELFQPNAISKGVQYFKCDESWSIDNLKIRKIKI